MKKHTRIAAYGLLRDNDKILLCRLSSNVYIHAGHWTLPGGGIDFGEDPQEAVVREFYEETGLTVQVKRLVTVDSLYDEFEDFHAHSIRIVYEVILVGGQLRFEHAGSTDKCEWLTESATKQLPLVALAALGVQHSFHPETAQKCD